MNGIPGRCVLLLSSEVPRLLSIIKGNKGQKLMKDKSNSGFGNKCSSFGKNRRRGRERKMTTQALTRAVGWMESLYKTFHQGPGDKDYLVRYRVSEKTGVEERYLYRLQYQRKGMKDVAGEAYRLLELAHRKYVELCEVNEEAADAARAERIELRKTNEANLELHQTGLGDIASQAGTTKAAKTKK